jgi:hypothetical protein
LQCTELALAALWSLLFQPAAAEQVLADKYSLDVLVDLCLCDYRQHPAVVHMALCCLWVADTHVDRPMGSAPSRLRFTSGLRAHLVALGQGAAGGRNRCARA